MSLGYVVHSTYFGQGLVYTVYSPSMYLYQEELHESYFRGKAFQYLRNFTRTVPSGSRSSQKAIGDVAFSCIRVNFGFVLSISQGSSQLEMLHLGEHLEERPERPARILFVSR